MKSRLRVRERESVCGRERERKKEKRERERERGGGGWRGFTPDPFHPRMSLLAYTQKRKMASRSGNSFRVGREKLLLFFITLKPKVE